MSVELAYPNLWRGRDGFREAVFARDGHRCVVCGQPAADAHHIIERRLWLDGGYYLDNGASVCNACHIRCETTEISVEDLRSKCGVRTILVPPDMYMDRVYDKWGNVVMSDGRRTRGPLIDDESVRKILAQGGVLASVTPYVSYPRTWHLPWSPGATADDRILRDLSALEGREVVVTVKMDGENFTGYADSHCHARAVDGRHRDTQDWVRAFWARRAHDLPDWWRVCCENLHATHSIRYDDLPGYLLGISIWDETNSCLAWDDTVEWFQLLEIPVVPVLYRGPFDSKAVSGLFDEKRDWGRMEGYVVRPTGRFHYRDFNRVVGKYVRRGHAATVPHGAPGRTFEINSLAGGAPEQQQRKPFA